ncbi:class A beta-lactamase-related serine hydrolase [Rhizobium leguminosarum]|uniref:serine hydrolase domain-containing protein n=1 Tax=Rhizobium leguminosarum TaxID=384 RepID=UPI00103007B4|nr:serine hydrolase domain-containing protein [Rhizobium leguminosarum]TAU90823.1 class A beta-lactamase-related serine hydrolase [Rhizobium leguminosarum]TAV55482.1 class A beta-lactamase-related serine hydrolase [Rhizobium leguminosarum]TAX57723.1 class A beta-lactamase-related serine hydrolase [Rhizobium leguminosarum]TAX62064.1 class A beta-lactamase-related serine hydrolase [Rhizobium leguminosarum]TAY03593.1 class A beta-lactamase-related serine hydrolase [Rhizobium leguminosarum]
MHCDVLSDFVAATAVKFDVPGVAVGVWAEGRESYACYGVTSVENPLTVDPRTLYVLGSVTKTYTATAIMRLAAQGRVDLDAPVRRYIPELVLPDKAAANAVTVLNLLNHTAGLDWRINIDTGEGDDALAQEVAKLAEVKLIAPPGSRASYSQAGYDLAGRIVEKVTGLTYENAMASLLFGPLGLSHSFFARDDVMTRRFAVGHNFGDDGKLHVAKPWRHWRSDNPGAGLASSVTDQIRWARFHLGGGRAEGGERILPAQALHRMKEPTVALRGSSLGDAFGICWFLRDVGGVRTVGHGGSANGQFANLLIVPEGKFAVVTLSNAGPDSGLAFNQAVVRWALDRYLGVVDRDPYPVPHDEARASEITGRYENEMMRLDIASDGVGLTIECGIRPEVRAAANGELPPNVPRAELGLLPGNADGFIVTSGGLRGQRGFFTRDDRGAVVGVDLAGRLFKRAPLLTE